jgi:single-strand DNA-binding protein
MSTLRNKVTLIGRIGAKAEIQNISGGYLLTSFSLATNERFKGKDGEWKDNTQWHNLKMWGKAAENLVKLTDKGSEIMVEGKIVNKQYESKTGEKRYSTEIEVSDFFIITKVEKEAEAQK